MARRDIFVSGGTGYLGRATIPRLLEHGHIVRSIARKDSGSKLPRGAVAVYADALEAESIAPHVPPSDTFVHLVGVPKPAPWKGRQFRAIDQTALNASVAAAVHACVKHFVYVSVAQPAPLMRSYIAVRKECELAIAIAGLNATILRPWYVLGPGHWWPVAFQPLYRVFEALPATRQGALRLGLVTLDRMVEAMVWAIENPCRGIRILDVPTIREGNFGSSTAAAL